MIPAAPQHDEERLNQHSPRKTARPEGKVKKVSVLGVPTRAMGGRERRNVRVCVYKERQPPSSLIFSARCDGEEQRSHYHHYHHRHHRRRPSPSPARHNRCFPRLHRLRLNLRLPLPHPPDPCASESFGFSAEHCVSWKQCVSGVLAGRR